MTKLSKISFFLFVTGYNYIWLRVLVFNYFYNEFGGMGIYYTAIMAVAVVLLFALVPKKLMHHNYEEAYKKSYFKYFYSIIILLENIIGIVFSVYLLSRIFIPTANFYVMLVIVSLAVVALSYYRPKDIMEISTLFFIVGYGILMLSLFFYPDLDVTLLLPFKSLNYWVLPFFAIVFFGENLIFLIDKREVTFSKLNLIMAVFVSLLLFGAEYFILICNAGDTIFKGISWVGFISLSIEPISKYIGNFDFAYIFYILICCIMRNAYNMSIVRNNMDIHHKFMSVLLLATVVILGSVSFLFIPFNHFAYMVVAILLITSSSIFVWFLKECYYVRKVKE